MKNTKWRLMKLETRMGGGNRPLRVIINLPPRELTDLELEACIQGCEPWQVREELISTTDELEAEITALEAKIAEVEAEATRKGIWPMP